MELRQDNGCLVVSDTSVFMKADAVMRSHRALRREMCLYRIIIVAFMLGCTAVSVFLFTQYSPRCKGEDCCHKGDGGKAPLGKAALQFGDDARNTSEEKKQNEPHQATLKISCKHLSASDSGFLEWDNSGLEGFGLSSDNTTLIIPSNGMYKISLQVTYRGSTRVLQTQSILELELLLYSENYPQDRTILSAYETIHRETTEWRKSVYSEGTFKLTKKDRLKVKTNSLRLVDCGGKVGTKTFFSASLCA